jgi:hypothetical protein
MWLHNALTDFNSTYTCYTLLVTCVTYVKVTALTCVGCAAALGEPGGCFNNCPAGIRLLWFRAQHRVLLTLLGVEVALLVFLAAATAAAAAAGGHEKSPRCFSKLAREFSNQSHHACVCKL